MKPSTIMRCAYLLRDDREMAERALTRAIKHQSEDIIIERAEARCIAAKEAEEDFVAGSAEFFQERM